MTTVNKKQVLSQSQFGGTPYGNATTLAYPFETNASGVYADSDFTTALQINDVVRIGVLPAGMRLDGCLSIVSDAFTAAATCDIGFQYVDGVDVTATPQDADYFDAVLALDAQGRTAAANLAVRPVTLPKDAYLILTIKGAALDAVGKLDLLIQGVLLGAP